MAQTARRASTAGNTFPARPGLMLVLATAGFALNFWAWALLSPLGPRLKVTLHLSPFSEALLVALPIVVGAVGRIPIGAMTDRFGGRVMLPAVSLAAVVPVLFLGVWGHTSYAGGLAGGFFLGIAGTSFAVGVPFVSSWFPSAQRGFALGIFGAGMGGTAISALTTVHLASALGVTTPFVLVAAMLVLYSAVAIVLMRDAPMSERSHASFNRRLRAAMELSITWRAAVLYAVGFGGYVAFSVYLPTYLKNAYLLTQSDAANRMAGFVLMAVIMRPVGGWLSDRVQPGRVLTVAFAMVTAAAVAQSGSPALIPSGTVAMLAMAAALGIRGRLPTGCGIRRGPAGRSAAFGRRGRAGGPARVAPLTAVPAFALARGSPRHEGPDDGRVCRDRRRDDLSGARSQGVRIGLPRMVVAGMNVLPPALLVLGLGIAVLGFAPRAAGGTAYGVVAISLFCRLLGSIDGWTHWLVLVSVFDAMSLLPAEPFSIWGSAVLAGTGVALCVVGAIGFRRLDRSVG